jgi:hypothetical protein
MSIVDSITQCAASGKLASDAWTTLVYATKEMLDIDVLKNALKKAEDDFKVNTGLSALPGSWRTNKSVLLLSREHGVHVLDDNGVALGKSAVEAAYAAKKEDKKLDTMAIVDKCLARIADALAKEPSYAVQRAVQLHIATESERICSTL